ncbi:MAG: hypothetical protein N4A72_17115 [Bacteroidales bacterium]|nr:hypothetical protein [Bacteroidales bacterium]
MHIINRLEDLLSVQKIAVSIINEFGTINIPNRAAPSPRVLAEILKQTKPNNRYIENMIIIVLGIIVYLLILFFGINSTIMPMGITEFRGKDTIWNG